MSDPSFPFLCYSHPEFARLAVGRTPYGLQIWCVRHNLNVYHLDLVGAPRPRAMAYSLPTEEPFADNLDLGCPRCGFDPGGPGNEPPRRS